MGLRRRVGRPRFRVAQAGWPDGGLDILWAGVSDKLRREDLSHLPQSVALRKQARDALAAALDAPTETGARKILADINAKIRDANRTGISGPSLMLVSYDVERVLRDRRHRSGR